MLSLAALILSLPAAAQHGVIREYAVLAPKPDATPLSPLAAMPLTGISITRGHDGAFYMTGSAVAGGAVAWANTMYIASRNLLGPYTRRRVGVLHEGHSTLFQDAAGAWYLSFFGNDRATPFRAMPGVAPLEVRDTGDDLIIGVK